MENEIKMKMGARLPGAVILSGALIKDALFEERSE